MKMRILDNWSNFGGKAKVNLNLTPRCLSEFGVYARRFFGFKALKTLLSKGYTPAIYEIEPDIDRSPKPPSQRKVT
jgi:hypothetical protein